MKLRYTEKEKNQIVQEVCEKIAEGRSLVSVLKDKKTYPARSTFLLWVKNSDSYAHALAQANDQRADKIFDELLQIVDNTEGDMIELPDGTLVTNHHVVQRDRLRFDARRWILAKMQPAKYSDRINVNANVNEQVKPVEFVLPSPEEIKKLKG